MKKFLLSLATLLCAGTFASAGEVTDVLNNANLVGSTSTTYAEYTYTAESGATYYAQCAGGNSSIQLRSSNSNSGVIVTNSVGTVKSITITFNSNTASGRVVNVYGSDTPFTNNNATGLYNGPTPLTTFNVNNGTTQTYTFETEYAYIGFRSNSGALYLDEVDIVWNVTGEAGPTVDAPTFSLESGKYTEAQTVSISAADGCRIYYTTDGQTPTDDTADGSTNLYTGPITISTTTTLKAIAFDADDNKSAVATATYTIVELLEGAEGDGTEANPYNAVGAYNEAILGSTATVYVKGIVVSKSEINTKYGSISYYISEDGTETNQFYIYSGLGLGGQKFTVDEELNVGDNVVVKGTLTTYKGAPQIDKNSEIVSINGETPAPIELEGDGTEANPFTVADIIKINPTASDKNEDYPDNYWVKGYIVGRVDGMAYSPVFSATAVDETTAVSITNIVLGPTADTADKNLCIPVQLVLDSDIRTALNLLDNPENLGKEVYVYGNIYKYFSVPAVKNTSDYKFAGSDSAIAVEIDANAPVEYYNLQGVRVDNPTNGLYIMRQGNKVVKVIK